MTNAAILLVLLSTLLHASWNMFSRKLRITSSAFSIGGFLVTLTLLPLAIYYKELLTGITVDNLLIIMFSSFFQAIYFIGVVNAYKHGSLSLSYPLLRSIPILIVLIYVVFFGDITTISSFAIAASFLIIIGCLLLPMSHIKDLKVSNYTNKMMLFVLVAALGTAGYSIIDSHGMKALATNLTTTNKAFIAICYIYLQVLFTSTVLAIICATTKSGRAEFTNTLKQYKKVSFSISLTTMLAYAPILAAMSLVSNVAYIVAFRQASIPIAFILGIVFLKEVSFTIRWIAIGLIASGLVISAVF